MAKVTIYTDGAAKGNPGPAGWGAVFLKEGKVFEIGGRSEHATNNIMELTGAIEALKCVKEKNLMGEVEVVSDSKYVILGITEWITGWMNNGWRNAAKKPVMNRELWEELYELNKEVKPKWSYVKGHNEHEHNDRADLIATSFAEGEPVKLRK
jgi:ribonuclease HI